MDCIIPHHAVRNFCASIIACSKIGKDLYLDFDPIDGLTLRTLNEAKSAYVCFKYEPSYFERCSAPPLEILEKNKKEKTRKRGRSPQQQSSDTEDENGTNDDNDHDNNDDDDDDDGRFTCRLSIKAMTAAVRQRKNVQSLRVHVEEVSSSLHLSFEYYLAPAGGGAGGSNSHYAPDDDGTWVTSLRVIHRVPIVDHPVVIISAIASQKDASELMVRPKLLLQLLEPLARMSETALIIPSPTATAARSSTSTASAKHNPQIFATCFQQQMDATTANNTSSADGTSSMLSSHLQTETRLSFEDLEEIEFVDDRETDHSDENDEEKPQNVNESVVLVFSRKEAKAVLQWSSAAMEHSALRMYFHWGGRPLVLEQQTETCKVELVLATLDYKIIGSSLSSRSQN